MKPTSITEIYQNEICQVGGGLTMEECKKTRCKVLTGRVCEIYCEDLLDIEKDSKKLLKQDI